MCLELDEGARMGGRKPSIWVSLAILIFAAPTVHAYEITTHAPIADHAYGNSALDPTNATASFRHWDSIGLMPLPRKGAVGARLP